MNIEIQTNKQTNKSLSVTAKMAAGFHFLTKIGSL